MKREIRRSVTRRSRASNLYDDLREFFEVAPVYKGWFRWRRVVGWTVNALHVEGASGAAVGGSLGYMISETISDVLPTKFSGYRWILENIQDDDDLYYYLFSGK